MDATVTESQLFTLADIEFAARRTAQLAFEHVVFEHGEEIVTTGDIRHVISWIRAQIHYHVPTLGESLVGQYLTWSIPG